MKKLVLLACTGLIMAFSVTSYATDSIKISDQQSDPFRDEMGQRFNEIFNAFFNKTMAQQNSPGATNKKFIPFKSFGGYPKTDMYESGNNIEVSIELPGIKKEEVNLQISQGLISIKYEDKTENERKTHNYTINERSYGSFERQISVPLYADVDKAKAEYKDGILYISIPKLDKEKIKAKKLDIQ